MTASPHPAGINLLASPFQRLAALLDGTRPAKDVINLSVGEPKHPVPAFVAPVLAAAIADFGRYPPIRGSDAFRTTVAAWLSRRYGLSRPLDPETEVIPLAGSREGLFSAALHARMMSDKPHPAILLPNPFYQAYPAGAISSGCEPVLVAGAPELGGDIDPDALAPRTLDRAVALYWASPANPQGTVTPLATWQKLIRLARKHNFLLLADECYSEIYRDTPVPGVLEAADILGDGYGHVVTFNSLSKRSNLPGLRCGFAAGDPAFLKTWAGFRNMSAPQVPLPVQDVAIAAYGDEDHVAANRQLYNAKYAEAEAILGNHFGPVTPAGGFFLWLDVSRFGDDVSLVKRLWTETGVRVVPGSYLAATGPDGRNPGAGFIRFAMVDSLAATTSALSRFVSLL